MSWLRKSQTIWWKITQIMGSALTSDEAQALGLNAKQPSGKQLPLVWKIHKLVRKRAELRNEQKKREIRDRLQELLPSMGAGSLPDT